MAEGLLREMTKGRDDIRIRSAGVGAGRGQPPSVHAFIDQTESMTPTIPPVSTASKPLRIALGADHGGVELKEQIEAHLSKKGFVVSDFGSFSEDSVDYPDYAEAVCREVLAGN